MTDIVTRAEIEAMRDRWTDDCQVGRLVASYERAMEELGRCYHCCASEPEILRLKALLAAYDGAGGEAR